MRLKVKKLLRGGEYFVSFENVDFTVEETERIEKFGMPNVDFSQDGLGARKLNEIDLSLKGQSEEDAEQLISSIRQNIRDAVAELTAKVDNFTGEEVIEL